MEPASPRVKKEVPKLSLNALQQLSSASSDTAVQLKSPKVLPTLAEPSTSFGWKRAHFDNPEEAAEALKKLMGNDESNGDASARIISERRNSNPTPPTSKEDFSLPKLVRNRTWSSSVGEKKLLKKNPSGSSLSISSGGQSVSPESSSSVSWGRFGFKEKKISVIVSKPSNSTYMVSPRRHRSTPYSLSMTDLLSNPSPPVTIEVRRVSSYCKVEVGTQQFNTKICKDSIHPQWEETYIFCMPTLSGITASVSCWQKNVASPDSCIGELALPPLGDLLAKPATGWLPLVQKETQPDRKVSPTGREPYLQIAMYVVNTGNLLPSSDADAAPVDLGPVYMSGWLTKLNSTKKRWYELTEKAFVSYRDPTQRELPSMIIYLEDITKTRRLNLTGAGLDNGPNTPRGSRRTRLLAGLSNQLTPRGTRRKGSGLVTKEQQAENFKSQQAPSTGTDQKLTESSTSFTVTSKSHQGRTFYLSAEEPTEAAMWLLAINGMRDLRVFEDSVIEESERYVYLEGFKGGILKFSPGEEEWHYSNKGLLTFSGHSENAENVSYLWDGESLVPKEGCVSYGCGKWDGVSMRWFRESSDPVPVMDYRWQVKDREYVPNTEKWFGWQWTRHFLASKASEGTWILEGEVPEPAVMMLQMLSYAMAEAKTTTTTTTTTTSTQQLTQQPQQHQNDSSFTGDSGQQPQQQQKQPNQSGAVKRVVRAKKPNMRAKRVSTVVDVSEETREAESDEGGAGEPCHVRFKDRRGDERG